MNPLWPFISSLIIGVLLSGLFLLSLQQPLQRLRNHRYPIIWLLGHRFLHFLLLLAVFYALLQLAGWPSLLVSVSVFIAARPVFIYFIYRTMPQ